MPKASRLISTERTRPAASRSARDPLSGERSFRPSLSRGPMECRRFCLVPVAGQARKARRASSMVFTDYLRNLSSNKPFRARPDPGVSMFISGYADGLKINCGRKWDWAPGLFFRLRPRGFQFGAGFFCGTKMIRKTELQMARSETTCR